MLTFSHWVLPHRAMPTMVIMDVHHYKFQLFVADGSFNLDLERKNKILFKMRADVEMFVFCSLILWQPRQLRQRLKHHWDQMVSINKTVLSFERAGGVCRC